jgi:hypothetical protein
MYAFVPALVVFDSKSLCAMAMRLKFDRQVTAEVLRGILQEWMEGRKSRDLKALMEELSSDICTHTHTPYTVNAIYSEYNMAAFFLKTISQHRSCVSKPINNLQAIRTIYQKAMTKQATSIK